MKSLFLTSVSPPPERSYVDILLMRCPTPNELKRTPGALVEMELPSYWNFVLEPEDVSIDSNER